MPKFSFTLYSVHDVVAKKHFSPSCFKSDAEAARAFSDLMHSPQYSAHHSDYTLYKIGTYDDDHGVVMPCDIEPVISGDDAFNNLYKEV